MLTPGHGAGHQLGPLPGGQHQQLNLTPEARDASTALTPQHVLLMFRCANQPADSFNTLAL